MRDWKEIAKEAAGRHPGGFVVLDSPHFELGLLPDGSARCYHNEFHQEFAGPALNPKQIRRFLWDIRNKRQVQRDRAFIETYYDDETDTSVIRLGTLTSEEALERLAHGTEV